MTLELRLDEPTRSNSEVLVHWLHLNAEDLAGLANGIVTANVQAAAQLGVEHVNDLCARLAQARQKQTRKTA